MKQPASRRKKRALAAPFVTTASALLLVAGGCGSNVEAPATEVGCPAGGVSLGASCASEGLGCASGTYDCAGLDIGATCQGGVWRENDSMSSCNPPPPPCDGPTSPGDGCYEPGVTCPWALDACGNQLEVTCGDDYLFAATQAPPCECPDVQQGDPCEATGTTCHVGFDECGQNVFATCAGNTYGVYSEGSCNPPPPDDCFNWLDEETCLGAGYCRWLVPGCVDEPGGPNLSAPGCYIAWDCASDADCLGGRTCQDSGFDPCVNMGCNACWSAAKLCLP